MQKVMGEVRLTLFRQGTVRVSRNSYFPGYNETEYFDTMVFITTELILVTCIVLVTHMFLQSVYYRANAPGSHPERFSEEDIPVCRST